MKDHLTEAQVQTYRDFDFLVIHIVLDPAQLVGWSMATDAPSPSDWRPPTRG